MANKTYNLTIDAEGNVEYPNNNTNIIVNNPIFKLSSANKTFQVDSATVVLNNQITGSAISKATLGNSRYKLVSEELIKSELDKKEDKLSYYIESGETTGSQAKISAYNSQINANNIQLTAENSINIDGGFTTNINAASNIDLNAPLTNVKNQLTVNYNKNTYPNITKALGWYLQGYEQVSAGDKTWKIYLGKEQKAFADISVGKPTGWVGDSSISNLSANMTLTFYNKYHYINALVVKSINADKSITVQDISKTIPLHSNYNALPPRSASLYGFRYGMFVSGEYVSSPSGDSVSINLDYTQLGIVDLSFNSVTFGFDNKNVGYSGNIIGRTNTNLGQNNLTIGNININQAYASIAAGTKNNVQGEQNMAVGYNNITNDDVNRSLVAGANNSVKHTDHSFTAGYCLINEMPNGTVLGQWNKESNNALLIVGKGTSEATRSNAFTINKDGSITIPVWNSNGSSVISDTYCTIKACKQTNGAIVLQIV